MPIPAELRGRLPTMKSRMKGLSDLQSNVDSAEASEVKAALSQLKRDEYKAVVEELGLAGNYSHGTHVAGIAMAGNPYARLVNARLEFGYKLLPDPCPSLELAQKNAKNMKAYVDFFRKNGVRVVNMSWGGTAKSVEGELELCNIGKTPDERKKIAREYFDMQKKALQSTPSAARRRSSSSPRPAIRMPMRPSRRPSPRTSCCPTCSRWARSTRRATRRRSRATARR